jgi:hypothetical protein
MTALGKPPGSSETPMPTIEKPGNLGESYRVRYAAYSHSIVAGGLLLMS